MRRPLINTIAASIAVLLLFGGIIFAAWRLDFLAYAAARGRAYPTAAAITFVGVLITAIASVLGILLKYSIDVRAEERLRLDAERNRALQHEAEERFRLDSDRNASLQRQSEDRLKLEAATEVIKLLSMSDGKLPPHIQRAGALFALSSLGQHHLTLALVAELLPKNQIKPHTAASLLNGALVSGDGDAQGETIGLLLDNTSKFLTKAGFEFPDAIMRAENLGEYVRDWTPILLGSLLAERPLADWQKRPYAANAIIAAIALAWLDESCAEKNRNAGAILKCVLSAFPQLEQLPHPRRLLDLNELRANVESVEAKTNAAFNLCSRLADWGCTPVVATNGLTTGSS